MVLIDIVSRERIVEVIDYITIIGEFESVFTKCADVDVEEEYLYPDGFLKMSNKEKS